MKTAAIVVKKHCEKHVGPGFSPDRDDSQPIDFLGRMFGERGYQRYLPR